jgi:ABC-type glycerol-3-phosphate transport system substrate-binding protein
MKLKKVLLLAITVVFLMSLSSFVFAGGKEGKEVAPVEVKGPALEGEGLAPISDEKIAFRGWQYKTHIVNDNVKRYNSELGGNVDYATITGDYPSIMETQFISKAPLDILYANPSQACRYYDGGWILPAEELPMADKIKEEMYPNILDAWSYKGKLLGLSYFVSVRGIMHANLKKMQKYGISEDELPATWDELYDQLPELRKKGIQYPILPHWFNAWYGISWGFNFEVLNRGGRVAHPDTHKPELNDKGIAAEVLRDWKRTYNAGLIPEEVFTYTEADYMDAWASGEYLYSPQQVYDYKRFNEERYCTFAGYNIPFPFKGQSWGLIDSAVYLMSNRERTPEHTRDVMAFETWYGYRDHKDNLYVGQRWMEESMLFSGYKTVMESEENQKLMRTFLARPKDYDTIIKTYAVTPYPKGIWNVVWAPEFNSWLKETLFAFLMEDKPVDETVKAIEDKINELNSLYGID